MNLILPSIVKEFLCVVGVVAIYLTRPFAFSQVFLFKSSIYRRPMTPSVHPFGECATLDGGKQTLSFVC
jgi:hypothetical protein